MSNKAKSRKLGTMFFSRSFVEFKEGDLFYSLQHAICTIHATKEKDHLSLSIRLEDTYDFDTLRTIKEDFSFANFANDLGYLLQHSYYLKEYEVNIRVKIMYP